MQIPNAQSPRHVLHPGRLLGLAVLPRRPCSPVSGSHSPSPHDGRYGSPFGFHTSSALAPLPPAHPLPTHSMPCSTRAGTQAYPRPPTVRKPARLPRHGHISMGSHAECPCRHSFHEECPCEPVCTPLLPLGCPALHPQPRAEPRALSRSLPPRPSAAPTASGRTRR